MIGRVRFQSERSRLATPHLGLIARLGRLARRVALRLRAWGGRSGRRLAARFVARLGTPWLAARFIAPGAPRLYPPSLVTAWPPPGPPPPAAPPAPRCGD